MNEEEKEAEWRRLDALEKEAGERMREFTKAIYALNGYTLLDRAKAERELLGKGGIDELAFGRYTRNSNFLDHAYGIKELDGTVSLIGEPYNVYSSTVEEMNRFCEDFGLEWCISHRFRALHYPGHTIAICFTKKEGEA